METRTTYTSIRFFEYDPFLNCVWVGQKYSRTAVSPSSLAILRQPLPSLGLDRPRTGRPARLQILSWLVFPFPNLLLLSSPAPLKR